MSRDPNGNYTLASGNPVTDHTLIESSWANITMEDISVALTDSLSRNGKGGMLVPFKNIGGTKNAPGMTWVLEPTSGFYRISTGVFGYAIGGTAIFNITASGINALAGFKTGTLLFSSGSLTDSSGEIDFGTTDLTGTGSLTFTGGGSLTGTWLDLGIVKTIDINGGTIDGAVIGGVTPKKGDFTTLTAVTYSGLPSASILVSGVVKLNNTTTSTSQTEAATAASVKSVQARADLGVVNAAAAQASANNAYARGTVGINKAAAAQASANNAYARGTVGINKAAAAQASANSAQATANGKANPPTASQNGYGRRTISTSSPSGGVNGDIWYQV